MRLIPIMMQRNTIELLKRIRNLTPRRRQATIQRHALHLARRDCETLVLALSKIHTVALLHVSKVDCVNATALVGDDGRLGVAEQSPRGGAEEGVCFDV